jgi:hypothetical protein
MFIIIAIALFSVAAIAATVVETTRDGYRRVPTRQA